MFHIIFLILSALLTPMLSHGGYRGHQTNERRRENLRQVVKYINKTPIRR